jgi:hypothetical protein
MSKEYTTIRVSQDAKAEAQQAKRDNETWNDYIQRCTDEPPEVREFVDATEQQSIDYAEIETRVESVLKEVLRG